MSIAAEITETVYALTASNLGPFATGWTYVEASDVTAMLDPGTGVLAPLEQGVDYVLAGLTPTANGGAVTLSSSLNPLGAWGAGAKLVIARDSTTATDTGWGSSDAFDPGTAEVSIDAVMRKVQELATGQRRALSTAPGEAVQPPLSLDGLDGVLLAVSGGRLVPIAPPGGAGLAAFDLSNVPNLIAGARTFNALTVNTIAGATQVLPGALITVDSVVLTFNGGFSAPVARIFNCINGGAVTFGVGACREASPEWWGAAGGDYTAAFAAAQSSGAAIVLLQAVDYFIPGGLIDTAPNGYRIQGVGGEGAIGQITRIIVNGPLLDVAVFGPPTEPAGGINNFAQGVAIDGVQFGRTAYPQMPATGNEINAPHGIRCRFLLRARITRCFFSEHPISASFEGCVATVARDNGGQLTNFTAGAGTTSLFWGIHCDGRSAIVAAGGNASLYLEDNNMGANQGLGFAVGQNRSVFADGAFVDTYIDASEGSGTLYINGLGAGATGEYDQTNFHVKFFVGDAFCDYGCVITNVGDAGVVIIEDYDVAPSATVMSGGAGFFISNNTGVIKIGKAGGLMQMGPSAAAIGLDIVNSPRVQFSGIIVDAAHPVVIAGSNGTNLRGTQVRNPTIPVIGAGVYVTTSSGCKFDEISLSGAANVFPVGIGLMDAASTHNDIDLTLIESAAATVKAQINGAAVTGVGAYNGNTVTGQFAS